MPVLNPRWKLTRRTEGTPPGKPWVVTASPVYADGKPRIRYFSTEVLARAFIEADRKRFRS